MQQFLIRKDSRLRTGVIAFAFLVVMTVVVVQWLARPMPDDIVERTVERERVPLSTRAELHWQSMVLGDRDAFLAGLSDDVLFVVQFVPYSGIAGGSGSEPAEETIVLNGLSAVADAYDSGSLKPFRARGAVVTVLEQTEDRVVGTILAEVEAEGEEGEEGGEEEAIRILEFTATVRINPNGRVFEERLEVLYIEGGLESVLNL